METDGAIREGGRLVGRVDRDGTFRRDGRSTGRIEDDGTIRRGGRSVGQARNCCGDPASKRTVAALLAFFGEWWP